jgi:hypothetical protein
MKLSPSLLMCSCGSLIPEFLRPGRNPRKHPASRQRRNRCQNVGQRNQRSYSLHLLEQRNLGIHFLGDLRDPSVIRGDVAGAIGMIPK